MLGERFQLTSSLDNKGRLALPARLRTQLQEAGIDELVLTCVDGGVRAFTPEDFATRIEGPYADADPFDPDAQAYFYTVLADAESCRIDGQGRIRVPTRLREQAGLIKEVKVLSMLRWVELWNPSNFAAVQAKAREDYRRRREERKQAQQGG
ncbi:MAG: hypothetical protein VX899_05585 [Myxococcota bacterium]|nr:hypothetical protein [Myxococcota bacterium]